MNNSVSKQLFLLVWGLHVLCVSAWDFSRHFPPTNLRHAAQSERKIEIVPSYKWVFGGGLIKGQFEVFLRGYECIEEPPNHL